VRFLLVGLFLCGFATATCADEYRACQEKDRPTIGMTEAQVEATCWGKPDSTYKVPDGRTGWSIDRDSYFLLTASYQSFTKGIIKPTS
jgi:hypothetical protein